MKIIPAHTYQPSQLLAMSEASAGQLNLLCHSQDKGSLAFYCGFQSECLILKNIPPKQSLNCTSKKNSPKGLPLIPTFIFVLFLLLGLSMENPETEFQNTMSIFILRMLAGACLHTLKAHWDLHVVRGALLLRWTGKLFVPRCLSVLVFL